MLSLISFKPGFGEPSMSSFCVKAMILLNLSGQRWRTDFVNMPPKGGYGKLPILKTPDGLIPDSSLIATWLARQGAEFWPGLSPRDQAAGHGLIRMAEENLRYGMMYHRWIDPAGWAKSRPVIFADLPKPVRLVLPGLVQKDIRKGLVWQGLGRFSDADRQRYFDADLTAIAAHLGDRPWLCGEHPTLADAAVLPVLAGIESLPVDTALRRAIRNNPALARYVQHGRDTLYAGLAPARAKAA